MIEAQIPRRKFGDKGVAFEGQHGTTLRIRPSNMGEPFREGLQVSFGTEMETGVMVFIQDHEAVRLAAAIDRFSPRTSVSLRM